MRINRKNTDQKQGPVNVIPQGILDRMTELSHQQDLREQEKREAIRQKKEYIVRRWVKKNPGEPEKCQTCPAAAEFRNKIQCFSKVIFLKKSGSFIPCRVAIEKPEYCLRPGM